MTLAPGALPIVVAATGLAREARIADLFERAVQAAVSGTWRGGTASGAWSIRTAKLDGSP